MPTASSQASPSCLAVPATQNTAPVHEYNCLYTHDIRRKSKRWQDGFLRYHTFNKRVMVYDVSRNFVGDTHWREGSLLQEGDEVTLDRCAGQVQVADRIGETETDLTEVRKNKKVAVSGTRPHASSGLPNGGVAHAIQRSTLQQGHKPMGLSVNRQPLQDKHRSLNALLGSSRPSIGKAVVDVQSPFERRRKEQQQPGVPEQRATKRRKCDQPRIERISQVTSPHESVCRSATDMSLQHPPTETSEVIDISSNEEDDDLPQSASIGQSSSMAIASRNKLAATSQPCKVGAEPAKHRNADQLQRQPQYKATTSRKSHTEPDQSHGMNIEPIMDRRRKLSVRTTSTRRKMLTCLSRYSADNDSELGDEQKKLEARLAQIARRSAGQIEKPAKSAGVIHSHAASETPIHNLEVIDLETQEPSNAPLATVDLQAGESSTDEEASFQEDVRIHSHRERKGSDPIDMGAAPAVSRSLAATVADSSERTHGLMADSDLQAYAFPSTIEIDRVLGGKTLSRDADDRSNQGRGKSMPQVGLADPDARLEGARHGGCVRAASPAKPPVADRSRSAVQTPWSREAFDLFEWRPPGWNEDAWCVVAN